MHAYERMYDHSAIVRDFGDYMRMFINPRFPDECLEARRLTRACLGTRPHRGCGAAALIEAYQSPITRHLSLFPSPLSPLAANLLDTCDGRSRSGRRK